MMLYIHGEQPFVSASLCATLNIQYYHKQLYKSLLSFQYLMLVFSFISFPCSHVQWMILYFYPQK